MSCESINQQAINLTVTAGQLPEGYCPPNFQQFFTDLAARLIVTPNQNFTSFVIGSLQPTSNQGPWLKDCLRWFVFDDTLSKYVPESQSFNNFQVFSADGNFTIPDDTYRIKVEAWGAGGGGAGRSAAEGGGGGGGGAYGFKYFNVIPSQSHAVMIGAGGTGGATGSNGTDATDTTFLTMIAGGGKGGMIGAGMGGEGGLAGIVTGSDIGINGENGITSDGVLGQSYGGSGGQAPNGGSGGTASITAAKLIGVTPGGGGAGGTNAAVNTGGNGAPGRLIVWW